MPWGKCRDSRGVVSEALGHLDLPAREHLAELFSMRFEGRSLAPNSWKFVPLVCVFKPGQVLASTVHSDSLRGIAICPQTYKLYKRILIHLSGDKLDWNYPIQFGSTKHHQGAEMVLIFRLLLEKAEE